MSDFKLTWGLFSDEELQTLVDHPVVKSLLKIRVSLRESSFICFFVVLNSFFNTPGSRVDDFQAYIIRILPKELIPEVNNILLSLAEQHGALDIVDRLLFVTSTINNEKDSQLDPKIKRDSFERTEWTTMEEKIFVKGLKEKGLDFKAISNMLVGRTHLQVRKHYQYLAKSLKLNLKADGTRRIKERGRRPVYKRQSTLDELDSKLVKELKDTVLKLEYFKTNRAPRGRPPKIAPVYQVPDFTTPLPSKISLPD